MEPCAGWGALPVEDRPAAHACRMEFPVAWLATRKARRPLGQQTTGILTSASCPQAAVGLRGRNCIPFSGVCSLCNVPGHRFGTGRTESFGDDSGLHRTSVPRAVTRSIQEDTYHMPRTSDGSQAYSSAYRRLDLGRAWSIVAACVAAMARRPASISTVSSPNAPSRGCSSPDPFRTARVAARNSCRPRAACPCQRRSEAAADIGMT